jgi:Ca2+-binding EF-hand superfamily protein
MDMNGDGRVSFNELLNFFRQYCGNNWIDPNFVLSLDRDGNGILDFYEVLTLYYIMKTRGVHVVPKLHSLPCGTLFHLRPML